MRLKDKVAVITGAARDLRRGRVDEALLAETERGAPEAGEALDIFLPLLVIDVDPVAPGEDEGALLLMDL